MIAFMIFVALCYYFIWPMLINPITDRQKEINDSLNAAEQARQEVELVRLNAIKIVDEAKKQSQDIVESAMRRKAQIVDEAAVCAKLEKDRILKSAHAEIVAERNKVKEELRKEISFLIMSTTKKIVEKEFNSEYVNSFVDDAIEKL
jgi:F-type H+-transporting ATPase subunit b